MDVGVGAVMFATGLSARKVRESLSGDRISFLKDFIMTIKSSFIVTIIGFLRFFIMKDINYQVRSLYFSIKILNSNM